MKYRKKPVVIEAFQYNGDLKGSDGNYYVPEWAVKAFKDGILYYDSPDCDSPPCELYIKTLEGVHHASVGDYIIQGVNGELYPCKPDIFVKTYETYDSSESKNDNPLIRIETDGNIVVLNVNGKHVQATSIDFHAEVNKDGDYPYNIIKASGCLQKQDENGKPYVKNDEIAKETFHYDSRKSKEIQFEEVN